jgi:hypothetical protein
MPVLNDPAASNQEQWSNATVKIITRQKGDRRWNLPDEFPILDCQGVMVLHDRRKLPDRRRGIHEFDDLVKILSRLSSGNTD